MKSIGDRVGHIELRALLGSGGMGEVFAGHDLKLDRDVAVKAIRAENFDAESRQRLSREARVLSRLEHRHICRIHDLIEEDGASYLILERIHGQTLRQAKDSIGSRSERLRIAIEIAEGLAAAHRNGIVHRDLKLDNVMLRDAAVSRNKREAVLLDFGLATVTSAGAPDADAVSNDHAAGVSVEDLDPLLSGSDGRPGTVTSMSPEQARGEPTTLASDIYGFGLLLQELLTGRAPYTAGLSPQQLLIKAIDADTLPVAGLDDDLRRLIEDMKQVEPVDRPSAREVLDRLRRRAGRRQRRRRWVLVAALVAVAVLALAKYTVDLRAERNRALQARAESEQRRQEAEEVVVFLEQLFASSDPNESRGETITARELLDRGAERVGTDLDQPLVRARLLETIGRVSRQLGNYQRAQELMAAAVEIRQQHQPAEHADRVALELAYGDLLSRLGQFEAAEGHIRGAVDTLRADGSALDLADALNVLAAFYLTQGRYAEAEPRFIESLAIRRREIEGASRVTAASMNNLAVLYREQGQLEEATELDRQALSMRQALLGDLHPEVAVSHNNLSINFYLGEDYAGAERHLRQALTIWRQTMGEEHPHVATALSNLGELSALLGEPEVAQQRFERALDIWQRALGPDHLDVAYATHGLGKLAADRGDHETARQLLERTIAIRQQQVQDDQPDLVAARADLQALDPSP